jgi:2-haloacid dehalogenase
MLQPQAVIFDIGNVLTRWQPEAFYDRVIGQQRRQALFAEVDLIGMNQRLDAGGPFRETVYGLASQHPEWADEIRFWHDRWTEMTLPHIDGSIALLHALKGRGVPVFVLTNSGASVFEAARTSQAFLQVFDRCYVSGAMGVMKPDPAIYAAVEKDCGLAPSDLLFTDDKAENIVAAARRGWRVHQFESWQGFAGRLVAEGLLTPTEAGL